MGANTVTVAFSSDGTLWGCPHSLQPNHWYVNTTFDRGITWLPEAGGGGILVEGTRGGYPLCTVGNRVYQGLRGFGFTRNNAGEYFLVAPVSPTVVSVLTSVDAGLHWVPVARLSSPFGGDLAMPAIASDGAGRAIVTFYTADPRNVRVWPWFEETGDDGVTWAGGFVEPTNFDPGPVSTTGAPRTLGDYQGIAVARAGTDPLFRYTYWPVWTDRERYPTAPSPSAFYPPTDVATAGINIP